MMKLNYLASLGHYVPELTACVLMIGLLLVEASFSNKEKGRSVFFLFSYVGIIAVLYSIGRVLGDNPVTIFTGSMVIDNFSSLAKLIMAAGTGAAIYLASVSSDIYEDLKSEFVIMVVGVMIGGMILASANNMLMLYIGIETLSILSYVLASFKKYNDRSSEAGLKYVLYGGISSGIMLFGMSHIYGVMGSINFSEIATGLQNVDNLQTAILAPSFIMFFVGLGYKIACVPFHMWSPDVYEGSPLPVTAFFSIVPKIAGIAVIVRVTQTFFAGTDILSISWIGLIQVVAALTMTVGNVSAIGQRSVKRMLAYSSIGHAGFMLLGVAVVDQVGTTAIMFYGITYLFMTMGAFFVASFVQDKYGNDHYDRFNGLITKHPLMAIMLTVVLFSLSGMPPLAGFVAKFNILYAVIGKKYYALALIAAINSVVAVYYYMTLVRRMTLNESESDEKIAGFNFLNQSIVMGVTLPIIAIGIFWSKIMHIAESAKLFLP